MFLSNIPAPVEAAGILLPQKSTACFRPHHHFPVVMGRELLVATGTSSYSLLPYCLLQILCSRCCLQAICSLWAPEFSVAFWQHPLISSRLPVSDSGSPFCWESDVMPPQSQLWGLQGTSAVSKWHFFSLPSSSPREAFFSLGLCFEISFIASLNP